MDYALWQSIGLAALAAGLSFLSASIWHRRNKRDADKKEAEALRTRRAEGVDERLRAMELTLASVAPLAEVFRASLIKDLTHFHTPVLDDLLRRIDTLTNPEREDMFRLLKERAVSLNGRIDEFERDAATMLPLVMRREERDRTMAAPVEQDLIVVSIPKGPGDKGD